jgi:hypothetical protein
MPSSVSVVVPVYNSSATLQELVARVSAALDATTAWYEIVLVNDGSRDDSWSTIDKLTVDNRKLRGIELMRNFGQHNAVLAGVRAATGDVIVTLDDDLQHPPEAIPALLDALTPEVDLVYGTPMHQQHSRWRNIASVGSKSMMTLLCGWGDAGRVTDFRAFRTTLREGFADYNAPEVTFDALLASTTQSIVKVPVEHAPRKVGQSNYRVATLMSYGATMATGYSVRPLRLIALFGAVLLAVGMASTSSVLLVDAATGHRLLAPGLVVALGFMFAGLELSAIGVVGEYVGRGHLQMLAKPTYLVRAEVGSRDDQPDDSRT